MSGTKVRGRVNAGGIMTRFGIAAGAVCLLLTPGALAAQTTDAAQPTAAAVAPMPEMPAETTARGYVPPPVYELPDPATLTRPELSYAETPEIAQDYEKYFYFHRDDTSFI